MAQEDFTNKLILGDNLTVLQSIPDKSVDLIYLDPPFFSNRTYEVIWGDDGEKRSFEDRFAGGIDHYISWLKVRVRQMHRILKDTGSIFLHCDHHASHYIKSQILDDILLFGRNNFRNEIIWHYRRWTANANNFQRLHDTIFWYSKSNNYIFNPLYTDYTEGSKQKKKQGVLHRFKKDEEPVLVSDKSFDEKGVRENDVWIIPFVAPSAKERIGYPTQKPEALLQRIIKCATNEGDVVLDPFVGGGTTIAVADRLNRRWIGIDQSVMAIKVSDLRMKKRVDDLFDKKQPYEVILPTFDLKKLQATDGKDFEIWIVDKYGGIPNEKGGKDLGIDGHTQAGTPIQVKKWKKPVGRDTLDAFVTAIKRDDIAHFERNKKEGQICGFIIGFDFSKEIINAVAQLKNKENIIIELKYIKDIIPYDNPPKVTLTAEETDKMKIDVKRKKMKITPKFLTLLCLLLLLTGCIKTKRELYKNRHLKSETHYRFGKETGTTTYYHKHYPTKIMEVEMKRGKRNGTFTERFFDGKIKLLAYYKNDLLEGVETHYHRNGNRSMETHYTKGLKNGPVTSWYFNGVVKETGFFVNDLFDGDWENYDERGLLVGEGTFVKGTGKRTTYDEMGRLKCETNFVNNKKEGLETHYLTTGEVEKTMLFKEDRIIEINGVPVDDL